MAPDVRSVAEDYWQEVRPGKRQALWTQTVTIREGQVEVKRVMRLVERTTEPNGQHLLQPDYALG